MQFVAADGPRRPTLYDDNGHVARIASLIPFDP
jgi:hypothetical protein